MPSPKQIGKDKIVYSGKIFEIVKRAMDEGKRKIEYEYARRSPGVRLIIAKNEKILLTKEFRHEQGGWDWRLPGGKVFDTLKEYNEAMGKSKNILKYAEAAAKKECLEETGLKAKRIKHFYTSVAGSTVIWDLFYFVIEDFEEAGSQNLESGEVISTEWKTFDQVKKMCFSKSIKEDRTIGVLLSFLLGR